MLVKNWPIKIKGTIKGISKEQAKDLFNYDLPDNAKGVTLRMFKSGKNFISPYYPERYISATADTIGLENRLYMKPIFIMLDKITPQILNSIIRPIWNPAAIRYKQRSGYHMFMKVNSHLLLKGLEYLQLSIGDENPPTIRNAVFQNNTIKLTIPSGYGRTGVSPVHNIHPAQLGFLLLDPQTLKIEHIKPDFYQKTINIKTHLQNPTCLPTGMVMFAYSKNGDSYSNSICIKIK